MKRLSKLLLSCVGSLSFLTMSAQNPYLPLWEYIPDGEPYLFEDPDNPGKMRVYVYGSHDNLVSEYCGRDQVVWSAPADNLQDWRFDGVIFESRRDKNGRPLSLDCKGDVLYAPDVTLVTDRFGKKTYYLYPNNQHGGRQGMIAKSSRPDGPFEVCNWDKDNPKATDGVLRFDPAVFTDDDGRVYGYWGFEQSYAAELDPTTMCTIKPGCQAQRLIPGYKEDDTFRFFEASSMRKIKDKYVFIYSRWTRDGEFGLPTTNYTLAYAYSNNPLGPYTYGGTIIDGRGRETDANGVTRHTASPTCNTHGSILEVNGQWYVFYHRHCGTDEYARQAMVAPITVEVTEGPTGKVKISEGEYTSEGFALQGLDPLKTYPAGIACYYTHPISATQVYPVTTFHGSHPSPVRLNYVGDRNPYDPEINRCPMVNNTDGSVIGYKYFNFSSTADRKQLTLVLGYTPEGNKGKIEAYIDAPNSKQGKKLGSVDIAAKGEGQLQARLTTKELRKVTGKHALFLVISGSNKKKSICQLDNLHFE